ncbi:hypothetical protein [Stieleria varia]|uniref:Uncharacterized protein n=1 Tax=Stieleria varia TaxID=2528005 RepID=A0A5C6AHI4_9BACT|nr:hypothetical protein [Stieleria varia]TWT98541.1 hypothetical protein Pla52n_50570 [Stieleria varia]
MRFPQFRLKAIFLFVALIAVAFALERLSRGTSAATYGAFQDTVSPGNVATIEDWLNNNHYERTSKPRWAADYVDSEQDWYRSTSDDFPLFVDVRRYSEVLAIDVHYEIELAAFQTAKAERKVAETRASIIRAVMQSQSLSEN